MLNWIGLEILPSNTQNSLQHAVQMFIFVFSKSVLENTCEHQNSCAETENAQQNCFQNKIGIGLILWAGVVESAGEVHSNALLQIDVGQKRVLN